VLKRADRGRPALLPLHLPRPSVSRLSLVLGAFGLTFILGASGFIALHEREVLFREARDGAQGAAFSLSDHAARLFEAADLALRTTMVALGDDWATIGASRPHWAEMRAIARTLPYVGDLWLNDATGRLRLTSAAFPTPEASVADRPAFGAVRDGDTGLVIGDPLLGRVTALPTFLIARRLEDAGGQFKGMVSATADLDYFRTYWHRIGLPNGEEVAIVRPSNGRMLVRSSDAGPDLLGSDTALQAAIATSVSAGRYEPAPRRSGYYHQVGNLALYLTVSFRDDMVEQDWRSWLWTFLLFPISAVVALGAIMALARRQSRVEALASREVFRARAQLATANRQLEQRVAERTADLKESNAEIQRFAYIVSHDLRAPLVNIMGFTSELQRLRADIFRGPEAAAEPEGSALLRQDFDEALGFIKSSIDKMDRLIRAILLLARQGSRVFDPEPVDTDVLMRSIADGVAHRVQSARAVITIGPLPRLVIDRIAAEQVFSNLVDNAVKYLRPGVPGEIVVSATVEDNRAVFRVADNGRGIDPRDHARVFELFRRSGQQNQPGDGIGLAHVRTLLRQLGGTISLESTLGQGSTFTVVLPLAPRGAAP
jgi:signal transduction histidine kinase